MEVRQPAFPPAVAPLGGQDHEVERVRLFYFDPIPRAPARFVTRVQPFHHETFVTSLDRFFEEALGLLLVGRDQTRRALRDVLREDLEARRIRLVHEGFAVEIQDIKEEGHERQLTLQSFDVELATEATHRCLEWQRSVVSCQCDRLAIQDDFLHLKLSSRIYYLRNSHCYVVHQTRKHLHVVALLVNLNPRAVEFVFERRGTGTLERLRHVIGGLRQHRLDGPKKGHPELCKAMGASLRPGTQISGKPRCSTYIRRGALQRLCDGLDHDQFERALAQLTRQQAKEKVLRLFCCSPKELAQQLCLCRRRAFARRIGDEVERVIHVLDGEYRFSRG